MPLLLYLEHDHAINGCPLGYAKDVVNIPDVEMSLGIHIATLQECADVCFRFPECVSFEHNKINSRCLLNPKGQLQGFFKGYLFCYNIGKIYHIIDFTKSC